MKINKLTMENFRSFYGTHNIPIDDKINTIIGPTGAGKTTLVKAFEFCLFGLTKHIKEDEIINDVYRANCEKKRKPPSSKVTLELEHKDKEYIISREFTDMGIGKALEKLTINGEDAPTGWIIEHLITPQDFELMNLIGIELNNLIKSFKTKKNAVRSLIGLPVLAGVNRNANSVYLDYIGRTNWAKEEKSEKISRKNVLEKELEKISDRIDSFETEEIKWSSELKIVQDQLGEERNKRLKDTDIIDTEINELQTKCNNLEGILDNKLREFEEIQENLPYFLLLKKFKSKLVDFKELLGEDIIQFYRTFGNLEGKLEAFNKYIGQVKPDDGLKKDAKHVEKKINEIISSLPGGELPKKEEFQEYLRIERSKNYFIYLEKQMEKVKNYKVLNEETSQLSGKIKATEKAIDDAIKSQKDSRKDRPEIIIKLEAKEKEFIRKHERALGELNRLRKSRDEKRGELRSIIDELSKYSEMTDVEEKHAKRAKVLSELFEALLREHEIDKIKKINDKAHDLFLTIIEKPEWFTGMEFTQDYEVKVKEIYHPKGMVPSSRPSTGEIDVMAISIALALNIESGNKMVILDDATINLDDNYTKKVLDAINKFGFEQVIMISKDTIKKMVFSRLDAKMVYEVNFDNVKGTSEINQIIGEGYGFKR